MIKLIQGLLKVDSSSRVAIPAHIRAKFNIGVGDEMDYFTTFADGRWFLCMAAAPGDGTNEDDE